MGSMVYLRQDLYKKLLLGEYDIPKFVNEAVEEKLKMEKKDE